MAWWFIRGVRRGIVTTRYPRRADPVAASFPTPPAFRPALLTAEWVDRIAAACPAGAISRQGTVMHYDVGRCTACGLCVTLGSGQAVPSGEFELAATARAHLVKDVPILGGVSS